MLSSIQWWTEVAKGKHKDAKFSDRVKASELLGRSQADFVEVRVAPIVTDPHASVESLVERFNTRDVIEGMPCTIRLLRVTHNAVPFHDFEDYERLVAAAQQVDHQAYLVVLLGGEAGLRLGEIASLRWADVDQGKRQLCVQRTVWKGHFTAPKGGRLRYVPLTARLAAVLGAHRHLRGPLVLCLDDGRLLT